MEDPSSLQNLHDIVMLPPVSWWPPGPGWYVVFGLLLILFIFLCIRTGIRYRRNAYRRAAIAELQAAGNSPDELTFLATVLKRTALAAYPREQVASLTGKAWVQWLSETGAIDVPESVGKSLVQGVYGGGPFADTKALSQFATSWICRHKGV